MSLADLSPRRQLPIVILAVVVLGVGAGVAVSFLSGAARYGVAVPVGAAGASGESGVRTGADPAERSNIDAVEGLLRDLPDRLAQGHRDVLAPGRLLSQVATVWPVGASTVVDRSSWRRTGSVASIDAEVTVAGAVTSLTAVVVRDETGRWLYLEALWSDGS